MGDYFKIIPPKLTGLDEFPRKVAFVTAVALTKTAQEAQSASIAKIQQEFTVRTKWYEKSNKFGVKVKPATKDNLAATISTQAWWLVDHERGGERLPSKKYIAIPTDKVKRSKRDLITQATRRKLLNPLNPQVFPLRTKAGVLLLAQRIKRGRGGLAVLFAMKLKVRIEKQSTFNEPVEAALRDKFAEIYRAKFNEEVKSLGK